MKRIGFVGLGTMGRYMAENILKAGYELFVHNRTPERMIPLTDMGATACGSPAEVGERCQLVVTCVSDAPDVEQVVMGSQGVSSRMQPPGMIVDCSTSSSSLAQLMEETLGKRGIGVLDAPISGGVEGAKNASLAIMVGGKAEIFEQALPILRVMGKNITLVGPAGAGQLAKAINQIIVACNLEAVAEGIALAKKSGIDAGKVMEAISGGAARSWVLEMRAPRMLQEDFSPTFTIKLHNKDLRLAMDAAEACGVQLDFAKRARHIFQEMVDKGFGEEDNSGVYHYMQEKNRI